MPLFIPVCRKVGAICSQGGEVFKIISSDFTVVTSAGCTATVGGQHCSAGRVQKGSPGLGVILLGA